MLIKGVVFEDFCNYREPSMFIIFPYCTFKCDVEYGNCICQNSSLSKQKNLNIDMNILINNFIENPITKAIVCGGLEPLDSWDELKEFIKLVRNKSNSTIVIYTGYDKNEILDKVQWLSNYKNIIVKFGRYIPNQKPHYDEILGIELASDNQYAEVINNENYC